MSTTEPRWFQQAVREVNPATRSLIITVGKKPDDLKEVEKDINRGTFEDYPSVRLLKADDGSPRFPRVVVAGSSTEGGGGNWLHLEREDLEAAVAAESTTTTTGQQIVALFPHVTELSLVNGEQSAEYQLLGAMLGASGGGGPWQEGLTCLRLINARLCYGSPPEEALFEAINGLTALRQLTLDLGGGAFKVPELGPVLGGRLEEVRFGGGADRRAFLRQLQQYASGQLRVDLSDGDYMMSELTALDAALRRRIVRLSEGELSGADYRLASLLPQFSSLRSVALECRPWAVRPIFAAISASLQQLLHLRLAVDFLGRFDFHNDTSWRGSDCDDDDDYGFNLSDHSYDEEDWEDKRPFDPPVAPLRSVKALELWLAATHEDLEWFNLPATMPALEAISLGVYYCRSCRRKYWKFNRKDYYDRETATKKWPHKCLRVVFGILGRTGVSPRQMSYLGEEAVCSVEELLNEEVEED